MRDLEIKYSGKIYEVGTTLVSERYSSGVCPICKKKYEGEPEIGHYSVEIEEIMEDGIVPIDKTNPLFHKIEKRVRLLVPSRMCSACHEIMLFDEEKGVVFDPAPFKGMFEEMETEWAEEEVPDTDFF